MSVLIPSFMSPKPEIRGAECRERSLQALLRWPPYNYGVKGQTEAQDSQRQTGTLAWPQQFLIMAMVGRSSATEALIASPRFPRLISWHILESQRMAGLRAQRNKCGQRLYNNNKQVNRLYIHCRLHGRKS